MKVKDLESFVYCEVVLYVTDDKLIYKEIYAGDMEKMPDDLLEREVSFIRAKRREVLDIHIRG